MKPQARLKHFWILGILLVFFPAIAFAGGSGYTANMAKRQFYLKNATKGNNSQAACNSTVMHYRLELTDGTPLEVKPGSLAVSRLISPGGTERLAPYYDVNKSVKIEIVVQDKCVEWGYVVISGKKRPVCDEYANETFYFTLGQLAETSKYEFT